MKRIILILSVILGLSSSLHAQQSPRTRHFNLEKGVAIRGYDPVAYFTDNKAIKGDKQWAAVADGVTYYFSSAAHKELFLKNYSKYEPQYGGWCAYAMGASNEKVEIDPGTFKIREGKLYLFYNKWLTNTLTKWNKDEGRLKASADNNWSATFH